MLFPLVFIGAAFVLRRHPKFAEGFVPEGWVKPMVTAWIIVAGLTFCGALWVEIKHYRLHAAYESGHFKVVEGIVENFLNKDGKESFAVDGVHFEYSSNRITGGFNEVSSDGGPIREGLYVRIGYIGKTIVKIEIGERDSEFQ